MGGKGANGGPSSNILQMTVAQIAWSCGARRPMCNRTRGSSSVCTVEQNPLGLGVLCAPVLPPCNHVIASAYRSRLDFLGAPIGLLVISRSLRLPVAYTFSIIRRVIVQLVSYIVQ